MDFTWCVDVLHAYLLTSLAHDGFLAELPTSEMFCIPAPFAGLLDLMCQTFEFLRGRIPGAERILRCSRCEDRDA